MFINSNHDALNIGKKMLNLYFMCNLYTIILKPDKKLEQNKPQFNVLSMHFLKNNKHILQKSQSMRYAIAVNKLIMN